MALSNPGVETRLSAQRAPVGCGVQGTSRVQTIQQAGSVQVFAGVHRILSRLYFVRLQRLMGCAAEVGRKGSRLIRGDSPLEAAWGSWQYRLASILGTKSRYDHFQRRSEVSQPRPALSGGQTTVLAMPCMLTIEAPEAYDRDLVEAWKQGRGRAGRSRPAA